MTKSAHGVTRISRRRWSHQAWAGFFLGTKKCFCLFPVFHPLANPLGNNSPQCLCAGMHPRANFGSTQLSSLPDYQGTYAQCNGAFQLGYVRHHACQFPPSRAHSDCDSALVAQWSIFLSWVLKIQLNQCTWTGVETPWKENSREHFRGSTERCLTQPPAHRLVWARGDG